MQIYNLTSPLLFAMQKSFPFFNKAHVYTPVIKLPTIPGKPHPVLPDIPLLIKERERFLFHKKRG